MCMLPNDAKVVCKIFEINIKPYFSDYNFQQIILFVERVTSMLSDESLI